MEESSNGHLSQMAESICQKRYYMKDADGNPAEDWIKMCWRVVNHVCPDDTKEYKQKAFDLIHSLKFLPNSPCLVNSGTNTKSRGLLACFVAKSPEDSWKAMVRNIEAFGDIARQGGGAGVNISNIRPEGDPVFGSTHAKACGPIEHMRMISEVMTSITQSGFRGMAMLATMRHDHPDIIKFIQCKQSERALKTMLREDIFSQYDDFLSNQSDQLKVILDKFMHNFNLSVLVTDEFMQAVEEDGTIDLVFNGKVYDTIKAKDLFAHIVENAWRNGDPGLLFKDRINEKTPYRYSGQTIDCCNPCGEMPLPELACCDLGSTDVSKFYNPSSRDLDWDNLRDAIWTAVRFLDNIIDANVFPTDDFASWAQDNRPIGLGVMGFADLLLSLRIAYGSDTSLELAQRLMDFFYTEAHKCSVQLAKEKGTPKSCQHDELDHRRNVTLLTIAPTGSISLLAGCSSSIEPIFSPVIYRYDNTGKYEMPHPKADKRYFRCAVDPEKQGREVTWQQHIDMQAAFQKFVDSGISKTVNMPNSATMDDVYNAYMYAWKSGCKGITIYRDESKTTQVLMTKGKQVTHLGWNNALKRPKRVDCDIFRSTAEGIEWHIIIGKVNDVPYEVFAMNGRTALPNEGVVVKRRSRHYSIEDKDGNTIVDNILADKIEGILEDEGKVDPTTEEAWRRINYETRRFSLELRHGIHPRFIVEQIDASNLFITSFSKAVGRIFRTKYLSLEDLQEISGDKVCPKCAEEDIVTKMVPGGSCLVCPRCAMSSCS